MSTTFTLRIAAPVVFGLYNLALALRTYTQRYPKVVSDLTLVAIGLWISSTSASTSPS